MDTLILSVEDIARVVDRVGLDPLMDEIIDLLEQTFESFDEKRIVVPPRHGFQYSRPQPGLLEWMPAMEVEGRATIKVVGYHPLNPETRELPTILSTLCAFDTASGHLLAMMDGTFLTALRTGAASAVASRILARPDSKTLGLIGCGAQAVSQLHALSRVFDLEEVLLYDVEPSVTESFAGRVDFVQDGALNVRPTNLDRLVGSSDIICTATSVGIGAGPVFKDEGCSPWLHVNAVGSDMTGKTELPGSLLRRSLVCPDFREQAMKEGECQQLAEADIGPELVRIVKERESHEVARERTTVFDSTGWALEDQVSMGVILRHAAEFRLGRRVQIEGISEDPRNPYDFLSRAAERRAAPEIAR